MRVAVDASCLNRDHLRGMGKYLWNVLTHANDSDVHWQLFGDRYDFPTHLPEKPNVSMEVFEVPGFRFHSWEQYGLPSRARRQKADLLFCTATSLPWWQPIPTVVTIHDTVPFETDGDEGGHRWYWNYLLPRCYKKAAAIITISESSKQDILRLWPELSEKLQVIRHGIDQSYLDVQPGPLSSELLQQGLSEPYLLYFGGPVARKRADWAIRVFQQIKAPNLQLVLCGFSEEAKELCLPKIPVELRDRVRVPSFISETDMPRLYQNAVALLYPTLYEGFGLPVIEAQAVGTPSVFSPVGSLAEFDGPGANLLPTEDFDAWVNRCQTLVDERSHSHKPLESARKWASSFSWKVSAERHLDVFRSVVQNQNRIKLSSS